MNESLVSTSQFQTEIDVLRAKVEQLKATTEDDPSDQQKDSETRLLQAALDQKTNVQNRHLADYWRARFSFNRVLFQAEQSGTLHAKGNSQR
jgi:hypothetical protein